MRFESSIKIRAIKKSLALFLVLANLFAPIASAATPDSAASSFFSFLSQIFSTKSVYRPTVGTVVWSTISKEENTWKEIDKAFKKDGVSAYFLSSSTTVLTPAPAPDLTSEENSSSTTLEISDTSSSTAEVIEASTSTEPVASSTMPAIIESEEATPTETEQDSMPVSIFKYLFSPLVANAEEMGSSTNELVENSSSTPVISTMQTPILEYQGFKSSKGSGDKQIVSLTLKVDAFVKDSSLEVLYLVGTEWKSAGFISEGKAEFEYKLPDTDLIDPQEFAVRFLYDGHEAHIDSITLEAKFSLTKKASAESLPEGIQIIDEREVKRVNIETGNFLLSFPGSLDTPLTLSSSKRTFSMTVIGEEEDVTAVRTRDGVAYLNAFEDTSLEYKANESGLKEYIHLLDKNHPEKFRYDTNIGDFDFVQVEENKIDLYEKGKKGQDLLKRYTISAPVMTDAEGNESKSIKLKVVGREIEVIPDSEWLKSAVYPVIVDPSVSITVINVHSHPVAGDIWKVSFVTDGNDDLSITPADQNTRDDVEFVSLMCGSEDMNSGASVSLDRTVSYPDWDCAEEASVSYRVTRTGNHHLIFDFGGITADAYNAALTWTGTTGDGLWSTGGNWSSGSKPTSADSVTFDNTCTNCNVTIDEDVTITSMTLAATYTGTITQGTGNDLTLTGAYSQSAGTYQAGNAETTYRNGFTLSGGTWNGGVGTSTHLLVNLISNDFTQSGGTYNAATTTQFTGVSNPGQTINVPTSITFYDLKINKTGTASVIITSGDTLIVTGTLHLIDGGFSTGTIDARGNIIQYSTADAFSAVIDFGNDSLAQTWTVNGGTGGLVRFNSASDASDSIVFNAAGGLYGASTTASFSGTIPISNPSNYDITLNLGGWSQAAGTFNLGSANVLFYGSYSLTGGSWIGGAGTSTHYLVNLNSNNFTQTGGTYTSASTTVFSGDSNPSTTFDVNPSITFENLKIDKNGGAVNMNSNDTIIVTRDLFLINGSINTGTIDVRRNIYQQSAADDSSAVIDFGDNSVSQTYTASGGRGAIIRFDNPSDASDTVLFTAASMLYGATTTSSFSGTVPFSNPSNYDISFVYGGWNQAAGNVNFGSANVNFYGNWTMSGGTYNGGTGTTTHYLVNLNGNTITQSGGTFVAASTTIFAGDSNPTLTLNANSSMTFENVKINKNSGSFTITSGDTLIATGVTTFMNGTCDTGTFEARGDVLILSSWDGGTCPLTFGGTANQTFNLTGATGLHNADITVNKSSGSVSLASALVMDASSQDLTILDGTLDLNGNNLTVNGTSGTFRVHGGTWKFQGGETLTFNTGYPTLSSTSTVEYNGSSSYTIKGYTYGNLNISGSGSFSATSGPLTLLGDFTQSDGTFTASGASTTVPGNFTRTGGTFTHNSGTVELTGYSKTVTGTTTFNNLYKVATSTDTLNFGANQTQTVVGTTTLRGISGGVLSLRSNSTGTQWKIDPQGTRSVGYLDVKDSNNTNATAVNVAYTGSTNSGNNTNWTFNAVLTQSSYRWYTNANSTSPGAALASENTLLTVNATTSPLRLRFNIGIGTYPLPISTQAFSLQFATATNSTWTDVPNYYDRSWTTGWTKRKPITITNSTSTLTNFQVEIPVTYDTDMQADFDDLRFKNANGTSLDYWIETYTSSVSATVWVEVDSLSANTTTNIYMYYGNSSATSGSSGANTFPIFEDMTTTPTGTLKNNAAYISASQYVRLTTTTGGVSGQLEYSYNPGDAFAVYAEVWAGGGSGADASWVYSYANSTPLVEDGSSSGGYAWGASEWNDRVQVAFNGSTLSTAAQSNIDNSTWHSIEVLHYATSSKIYWDNTLKLSYADSARTKTGSLFGFGARTGGSTNEHRIRNIYVRKYELNSPSPSFGAEEAFTSNAVTFYDNTLVSTSSALTSTLLSGSTATSTYEEENPTATNPIALIAGDFLEFDFPLLFSNAVDGATYYFRFVISDNTVLDAYTRYASMLFDSTYVPNSAPDAPTSLGATAYVNGSTGTDNTPDLSFTLSDPDVADTVKYRIQIDDTSDFSSVIIDYSSALGAQGTKTFTVGQAVGSGTYTTGSGVTSLSDGSYYWRVKAIDEDSEESSYSTANSGAVAFVVNTATNNGNGNGNSSGSSSGRGNGPASVLINNGMASTSIIQTTLTLNGNPNTAWMSISNSLDLAGAVLLPYSTSTSWNICQTPSCPSGIYTVHVKYLNAQGHGGLIVSDSIIYIRPLPPTPPGTTPPPVTPPSTTTPPVIPPSTTTPPVVPPVTPPSTTTPRTEPGDTGTSTPVIDVIIGGIGGVVETSVQVASSVVNTIREEIVGDYIALNNVLQSLATLIGVYANTLTINFSGLQKYFLEKNTKIVLGGINAIAVAPALLMTQYSLISRGVMYGVHTIGDLWLMLVNAINALLTALKLRAKRRYWGRVYDTHTKQPIDPAIVELVDAKTGEVVQQTVTDLDGRYGFLDRPGEFYIQCKKTHYVFPSKEVLGSTDGIYEDCYHGEKIIIKETGNLISPNIPMDPEAYDWNQEHKRDYVVINAKLEVAALKAVQVLFILGALFTLYVLITSPSLITALYAVIYLFFAILRAALPAKRLWGRLKSASSVEGLYLELHMPQFATAVLGRAVVSQDGRFFLKSVPGEYVLQIKKVEGESAKIVKETRVVIGPEGVLNSNITL